MKVLKLDVTHELIGSKALNLKVIERSGCKVPETFVLFNDHINTRLVEKSKEDILSAVEDLLPGDKLYAVRSAKGIEDSQDDSFAGIFRSVLNVKKKNIYAALKEVAKSYDKVVHKPKERNTDLLAVDNRPSIKDAILIQEMITPLYSGVLFSVNPVNSDDEMLLEMVEGLGDQLDQEGIDPLRASFKDGILTFDDRLVQDDESWLNRVFKEALKVRKQFGGAIDCEWVYDGEDIFWLQVRPVTALGNINVYENGITKDYIKEIMKPLEYDLIMSTTVRAWLRLANAIDSHIDLDNTSIARSFFYRPYFNHNAIGEILDEMGLDSNDVEVLVQFDGETFKSSFTLLAKAFFHLGAWVEFFFSRRKHIQHAYDEVTVNKEKVKALRQQLQSNSDPDLFLSSYYKLKELFHDSEYLNILIRVGPLKSVKKYQKELDYIVELKDECEKCINECGSKFGSVLVERGYLTDTEDIMFVSEDLLVKIINEDPDKHEIIKVVSKHKRLYNQFKDSILPKVINGEENPILQIEKENKVIMNGIPMSKGRIKGTVRRLSVDDDLESIKPDEIAVIPFADMIFEPILANASGILLKTGGILSHLAILSREHNIPAVTAIADIDQLEDGMEIIIDGYSGEIVIL